MIFSSLVKTASSPGFPQVSDLAETSSGGRRDSQERAGGLPGLSSWCPLVPACSLSQPGPRDMLVDGCPEPKKQGKGAVEAAGLHTSPLA